MTKLEKNTSIGPINLGIKEFGGNIKMEITEQVARILMREYGSPLYVYSEEVLRTMSKRMVGFLENTGLNYNCHYAVKANNNPHLLKIMREEGLFVDSMSPLELELVERAGFTRDEILYVCNNISAEEMREVHDKGIPLVLDSVSQVETFGKTCPNSEILVRINPGVQGVGFSDKVITAGEKTKFGISTADFDELFSVVEKYNLKIIGLHQHLGTLFLDDKIDDYIRGVETFLKIAKKFKDIKIIDLGGGFGISYQPDDKGLDFDLLKSKLVPVLKNFIKDYGDVEFKFEPGRIIVAESSSLLGTVMAVKNNGETTYVGTDIGMGTIERPSRYDSYHHIETFSNGKNPIIETIVVGNVCESGDILGKDRNIYKPEVGDPIVLHDAGAYGYSMASNYTGRLKPAEVLIRKNGSVELIRKGESSDDVLKLIPGF